MTNGSVSAHLDGLPHFKSFSETEQFKQASPLPHYRRVKGHAGKIWIRNIDHNLTSTAYCKTNWFDKMDKICLPFLSFFNNHTPHSNRLTIEYNHCNIKLHRFSAFQVYIVYGYGWSSMVADGCRWLSLVIVGCQWFSLVVDVCLNVCLMSVLMSVLMCV